jgi:hypothetical protein
MNFDLEKNNLYMCKEKELFGYNRCNRPVYQKYRTIRSWEGFPLVKNSLFSSWANLQFPPQNFAPEAVAGQV